MIYTNALLPKCLHTFDENCFNQWLFENGSLSFVIPKLTLEHHTHIAKLSLKINEQKKRKIYNSKFAVNKESQVKGYMYVFN